MSQWKKETTYQFKHPDAVDLILAGLAATTHKGSVSEAARLRGKIKFRQNDIKLLQLYMPHKDEATQERAEKTIAFIQAEIDDMEFDLKYASERRAA